MIDRTAEFERFYAARASALRRAVAACVTTMDEGVIDDACAYAWLTLVRRSDIDLDDRGGAWMTTVAIREGWRLASVRRDVPSGTFRGFDPDPLELPEPPSPGLDTESVVVARLDHARRISLLRTLTAIEQRVVILQAFGFTYSEIARDSDLTAAAVNGHLSRARAKLASTDTG